jgi:hypothetical protein
MNDTFGFKLPEYKKARIEIWKYLSLNDVLSLRSCFIRTMIPSQANSQLGKTEQTEELYDCDYDSARIILSKCLDLRLSPKQEDILVDSFFYLVKFGIKNGFSNEQLSELIYTLKCVHDLNTSTSFDNLEQTFDYLKNILILFSVNRPPFSFQIFEANQAKYVFEYFAYTYFNQFKLYKLIFTPTIKLDLKFNYGLNVELSNKSLSEFSISNIKSRQSFDDEASVASYTDDGKMKSVDESFSLNVISEEQPNEQDQQMADDKTQQPDLDEQPQSKVKDEYAYFKTLIRRYFNQQLNKVKLTLDSAIRESETEINRKIVQLNTQVALNSKTKAKKPVVI